MGTTTVITGKTVTEFEEVQYVFRREQKTGSGADVICCGRLFQIRTVATGKAQSLQVESRVRGADSS